MFVFDMNSDSRSLVAGRRTTGDALAHQVEDDEATDDRDRKSLSRRPRKLNPMKEAVGLSKTKSIADRLAGAMDTCSRSFPVRSTFSCSGRYPG